MTATEGRAARAIQAAAGAARGPVWRALLEAQWRARLQEVTELSLAYHEAAASGEAASAGREPDGEAARGGHGKAARGGHGKAARGGHGNDRAGDGDTGRGGRDDGHADCRELQRLLRRAVAARQALANTEEALRRLASGRYGLCEGCAAAIPAWLLTVAPDTRYCPRCRPRPIRAARASPTLA